MSTTNNDTAPAAAVAVEEGSLELPDGTTLYTKSWKPEGKPRAIVAFYHGFSDHCNTFYDFFPALAASGFEVRSLDQRGWGRSASTNRKQRGDIGTTTVVMADLHFYLQSLVPLTQGGSVPLFIMGHSMGGENVLYYALNPKSPYHSQASVSETAPTNTVRLAGVLSIAPLVAVHPTTQPLKIVEVLGRFAAKLLPKMTMVQQIDAKWVSRDPQVVEDIRNDGFLCHKTASLEGLEGMLDRGAWLDSLRKKPDAIASTSSQQEGGVVIPPLWIGHGTADRITWFDATKRLADALTVKDKTFKVYEGAYHKLMNDTSEVAEEITRDVLQWIEARIPAGAMEATQ